ncbi:MAG TPA: hypothetical protein VGL94_12845 [Ktedonobacteraceae bacterium]|jgi:chromosome segregation ATPase
MEERMRNLEKRIESLELAQKTATEADHLQHQQMQLLRTDVQETNSLLKRILPDVGTSREKLDTLTHGQEELVYGQQGLLQEIHAISKTWVESLQENFDEAREALVEIRTTQGSRNERFDHLDMRFDKQDKRMDSVDSKLDQILKLLQQKP